MASKYIYITLAFMLSVSWAAFLCQAQDLSSPATPASPASPADTNELHLNSNDNTINGNLNNGNQPNNQQQQQQRQPSNDLTPVLDDDDSNESDDGYSNPNQQFHILPFPFFQRRDPISAIFEQMRRHRLDMDKQFSQLERQAGEGQDISYFYRNGVQYIRTCVTKRVQPQGQDPSQGQLPSGGSS